MAFPGRELEWTEQTGPLACQACPSTHEAWPCSPELRPRQGKTWVHGPVPFKSPCTAGHPGPAACVPNSMLRQGDKRGSWTEPWLWFGPSRVLRGHQGGWTTALASPWWPHVPPGIAAVRPAEEGQPLILGPGGSFCLTAFG